MRAYIDGKDCGEFNRRRSQLTAGNRRRRQNCQVKYDIDVSNCTAKPGKVLKLQMPGRHHLNLQEVYAYELGGYQMPAPTPSPKEDTVRATYQSVIQKDGAKVIMKEASKLCTMEDGLISTGLPPVPVKYSHPPEMSCATYSGAWEYKTKVPNTVTGVHKCAAACRAAGAKYLGLYCANTEVPCYCASKLDLSMRQPLSGCNSYAEKLSKKALHHRRRTRHQIPAQSSCPGPYTQGKEAYAMGSVGIVSVYLTKPIIV
jgi:hypothetical protein